VANNPDLKNSPQLEPLRKTLLKEPLGYFQLLHQSLQTDLDTRPESLSRLAEAAYELGVLTEQIGDKQDALLAYDESRAILERLARDNPTVTEFENLLGGTLNNMALLELDARRFADARDRLRGAVEHQKRALADNPLHPTYRQFLGIHYSNLLRAASGLGDAGLAAETRRGLAELAASDPRFAAVDHRLAAVLQGEPANDAAELLSFGKWSYDTSRFALAARFYGDALNRDAALLESREEWHAYNAACSAALAGCGQGFDDPPPDGTARARLRGQSLVWLREELDRWTEFLKSAMPDELQLVAQTLKHWQTDPDLAGIRDPSELAKLPDAEQTDFRTLWQRVDEVLARASGGPGGEP
jgi:tetratricopeptide (TPR) repeat protein